LSLSLSQQTPSPSMTDVSTDQGVSQSQGLDPVDTDVPVSSNTVHQRLRANSTIMQLKKILGIYSFWNSSRSSNG